MIKVEIHNSDHTLKQWYRNFVLHDKWESLDDFDRVLASWNGRHIQPTRCDVSGATVQPAYLEFDSTEAATVFVLRWS